MQGWGQAGGQVQDQCMPSGHACKHPAPLPHNTNLPPLRFRFSAACRAACASRAPAPFAPNNSLQQMFLQRRVQAAHVAQPAGPPLQDGCRLLCSH